MATQQLLVESRNTAFLAVEYQLQTLGKSYALLLARIPSHASTISHAASLDNEGQLTATTSRNELYSKENDDATYYPSKHPIHRSKENLFSINYCLANQEAKGRSTRGGVKEAFTKLSEAEKEFYSEPSKTNKSRKISPIKHSLRITLPLDVVRVDAERRDRFRDARCRRMQSGGIGAGARGTGGGPGIGSGARGAEKIGFILLSTGENIATHLTATLSISQPNKISVIVPFLATRSPNSSRFPLGVTWHLRIIIIDWPLRARVHEAEEQEGIPQNGLKRDPPGCGGSTANSRIAGDLDDVLHK
ncbi:hypothetical protein JB92DRAFT_3116613 [Gautieria morchelliformis]|nr:hypothetical protein JB92DRAFT_3116613 [Gautieria morchelliformis]